MMKLSMPLTGPSRSTLRMRKLCAVKLNCLWVLHSTKKLWIHILGLYILRLRSLRSGIGGEWLSGKLRRTKTPWMILKKLSESINDALALHLSTRRQREHEARPAHATQADEHVHDEHAKAQLD